MSGYFKLCTNPKRYNLKSDKNVIIIDFMLSVI